MTVGRFRFSTAILRRLGEELNPSLDQGVLELVKNAHDADARSCDVSLINVEAEGGTLRVSDDGSGMTAEDIEQKFLLLGRSTKSSTDRTPGGRIPAGSKGLGRLAALRAGREVSIITRPGSDPRAEHHLSIEWERFDEAEAVEDVALEITTSRRKPNSGPGTTIEVRQLTRRVGRREAKRLARALLLLADPFDDDPNAFRPTLTSDEFKDLERLVQAKYFDSAEYHLHAEVDETGRATAAVLDWRGQALFVASHSDLVKSDEGYSCPPAEFDFWVFILDAKTFQTRSSSLGEVRAWLQEFGGVMLYVNGLRVAPYGDPGNDWLDINLRRTQSPEERPSTNTSIGRLRVIDQDSRLIAKTDRSGMIENVAFNDLRRLARDSLDWMARERLQVAERRRQAERLDAPKKTSRSREALKKAIAGSEGAGRSELQSAFESYEKSREREVNALRQEVQLYRTLSTAGITAATFAHESSGGPIKIIVRAVGSLKRRLAKLIDPLPDDIRTQLDAVATSASSLGAFSDTALELVDRDKRRVERVSVHEVIDKVISVYKPFFDAREVDVQTELCPGSPFLQGSVAAIESILVNLVTNSLTALTTSAVERRMVIVATSIDSGTVQIRVADNAGGLKEFSPTEIWLPGVTSRPGGSGLGLTIVRDTTLDLGGRCTVVERQRLPGAEFVIELPILGY